MTHPSSHESRALCGHEGDVTAVDGMAWAAGLFEGEGCICVRASRGRGLRKYVHMSLMSTDQDVVERFAASVGCGTVRASAARVAGWKDRWIWELGKTREIESLLRCWLPLLGARRTEKAHEALAACALIGPPMAERTHCSNGHEYTPDNTAYFVGTRGRQRRCRACRRRRDEKARTVLTPRPGASAISDAPGLPALSQRQQQLLDVLGGYSEPQPAMALARIMRHKHGLASPSQVYDLLGVLRKKDRVRLVGRCWEMTT